MEKLNVQIKREHNELPRTQVTQEHALMSNKKREIDPLALN